MSCFSPFEARNSSHGQRTEAARIARRKNPVRTDHHQRKRAFHPAQRVGHGLRQRVLFGERDQVNDDFGVAIGLEDRALASRRLRISCAFTRLPLCASAIMPLFDCTMMG